MGVRGGFEEGKTGRSSSIICGVTEIVVRGDEEGGWPRMSESACSESRSSSRNKSKFSYVGGGEGWREGEWKGEEKVEYTRKVGEKV